jgi:hypothetical protein
MPPTAKPLDLTLLASLSRTVDPVLAPADITGLDGAAGVAVTVDVTTAGTGSITCFIEGFDVASGKWWTVLAGAAVTTVVTNTYIVYPGITDAANSRSGLHLPRRWRVRILHNNANAITYSVGASVLP